MKLSLSCFAAKMKIVLLLVFSACSSCVCIPQIERTHLQSIPTLKQANVLFLSGYSCQSAKIRKLESQELVYETSNLKSNNIIGLAARVSVDLMAGERYEVSIHEPALFTEGKKLGSAQFTYEEDHYVWIEYDRKQTVTVTISERFPLLN